MQNNLPTYLNEYAESHQNPTNKLIHTLCVPLITWSIVGILHSFIITGVHLSYIFILVSLVFYSLFKKILILFTMTTLSILMLTSYHLIPNLFWTCLIVFVIGWVGQFYGHHLEGKRPSFFKDVTFLLIGPVWVLKKLFPKIDQY
ncbi:MAG: Mpo1-like protein [Pseudobdellovibrio sp.]